MEFRIDWKVVLVLLFTAFAMLLGSRFLSRNSSSVLKSTGLLIPSFRKKSILLLGLPSSGKTCLLYNFSLKELVPTVQSMQINKIKLDLNGNNQIEVVDVPGHVRLRGEFVKFLEETRKIIFVIDSTSSSFLSSLREQAEFLYLVLSQKEVAKQNGISVLILCNKQDSPLAYKKEAIKNVLEKEMNIIRSTKSRELASISEDEENVFLGFDDSPFTFEDLETEINVVECSIKHRSGMDDLSEWILKV